MTSVFNELTADASNDGLLPHCPPLLNKVVPRVACTSAASLRYEQGGYPVVASVGRCREHAPRLDRATEKTLVAKFAVVGTVVDYYSVTCKLWLPAWIQRVDLESGCVCVNLKPDVLLSLREMFEKLRPRTRPNRERLEWVATMLKDGWIDDQTLLIFNRYATRGETEPVIRTAMLDALGTELDGLLGITGTRRFLMHQIQQQTETVFTFDVFHTVFWEALWKTFREYGQILSLKEEMRRNSPESVYELVRKLGSGTYGTVMLAIDKKTQTSRAIKVLSTPIGSGIVGLVDREVRHLLRLNHPNIVKLYEFYYNGNHAYLVMDFCSYGDLFAAICKHFAAANHFVESYVSHVMTQIMLAITYVHSRGIVHLDLKPANIMLMPEEGSGNDLLCPHVMVIDLGVAQIFHPGNFDGNDPMGSPNQMAPEVWNGEITPKADIFSLGVVFFEMLSLMVPFQIPVDARLAIEYWSGMPPLPLLGDARVAHSSPEAVSICQNMVAKDRHRRPTASQCLLADFFQLNSDPDGFWATRWSPGGLRMKDFFQHHLDAMLPMPERSVFHKLVALKIAGSRASNLIPTIKRAFLTLNAAGNGQLEKTSISRALEQVGVARELAAKIADSMDLNRDGAVGWTEFAAGCTDLGASALEGDLRMVFDEVDEDSDGYLTFEDLSRFLTPTGHQLHDNGADEVFCQLAKGGAHVDWPAFLRSFQPRRGKEPTASSLWFVAAPRIQVAAGQDCPVSTSLVPVAVSDLFTQATQLVDHVRLAGEFILDRDAGGGAGFETNMTRLADMGFTNRAACEAVLLRHNNRVNERVVATLAAM